jgi:hypothetical protein
LNVPFCKTKFFHPGVWNESPAADDRTSSLGIFYESKRELSDISNLSSPF